MITVATNSVAFEQRVRRAFTGSLNGDLRRMPPAMGAPDDRYLSDLVAGGSSLVAVGPDVPLGEALDLARMLDVEHPEVTVVIVAEPLPEVYEAALRAGVRDVISANATEVQLREAFERVIEVAERRRISLLGYTDEGGPTGRVITVAAPKGGSGKTAIATNLAVSLARLAPGRVVLVDLDLQFGDVTDALGMDPVQTIADAAHATGVLDPAGLKAFLTPWKDMLYVLCAPASPGEGDDILEPTLRRMVGMLASEFDYVVIDTPAGVTEQALAAFEHSSDVLLVCDLSVAAVRSLRKLVWALDRIDLTSARRLFVLNRADSKVGIDDDDVADLAGMPIDIKLPSTRAVPRSMNQGQPLVVIAPRSQFSKRIDKTVDLLVAVPAEAAASDPPRRSAP